MLIGEFAKRGDVSIQTIRFYERERLLPSPIRRASGYRESSEHDLSRLRRRGLALASEADDGHGCTRQSCADSLGKRYRVRRDEADCSPDRWGNDHLDHPRADSSPRFLCPAQAAGSQQAGPVRQMKAHPEIGWAFIVGRSYLQSGQQPVLATAEITGALWATATPSKPKSEAANAYSFFMVAS